jgi:gas vesicle protein
VSDTDSDSQSGLISLLAGIGVGVIIGGVTALLLAPQSGAQTRAQIKESADDTLGRLRESMDDLRTKFDEVASSISARRGVIQTGVIQGDVAGATDDQSGSPV